MKKLTWTVKSGQKPVKPMKHWTETARTAQRIMNAARKNANVNGHVETAKAIEGGRTTLMAVVEVEENLPAQFSGFSELVAFELMEA